MMAAPASNWPKWAECVTCWNPSVDPFVTYGHQTFIMLPCAHFACAPCYQKLEKIVPLTCTTCKRGFKKGQHFAAQDAIKPLEFTKDGNTKAPKICNLCIRKGTAVSRCKNCDKLLCRFCTEQHSYAVATSTHSLSLNLESEQEVIAPGGKCEEHLKEIKLFCKVCDKMICSDCACNSSHQEELSTLEKSLEYLNESVALIVKSIGKSLTNMKEKKSQVEVRMNHLLTTEKDYLFSEAATQLAILISRLMAREAELQKEIYRETIYAATNLKVKQLKCITELKSAFQYAHFLRALGNCDPKRVNNKEFLKAYKLAKEMWRPQQELMSKYVGSNGDIYFQTGLQFHMDKRVRQEVEKKIATFGKITYSYSPNSRIHKKLYKDREKKGSRQEEEDMMPLIVSVGSLRGGESAEGIKTIPRGRPPKNKKQIQERIKEAIKPQAKIAPRTVIKAQAILPKAKSVPTATTTRIVESATAPPVALCKSSAPAATVTRAKSPEKSATAPFPAPPPVTSSTPATTVKRAKSPEKSAATPTLIAAPEPKKSAAAATETPNSSSSVILQQFKNLTPQKKKMPIILTPRLKPTPTPRVEEEEERLLTPQENILSETLSSLAFYITDITEQEAAQEKKKGKPGPKKGWKKSLTQREEEEGHKLPDLTEQEPKVKKKPGPKKGWKKALQMKEKEESPTLLTPETGKNKEDKNTQDEFNDPINIIPKVHVRSPGKREIKRKTFDKEFVTLEETYFRRNSTNSSSGAREEEVKKKRKQEPFLGT